MGSLVEAFRFLSVLPIPGGGKSDDSVISAAVASFPLVGLFLGALLVLADWASSHAFPRVSHFLSAALILVLYALFTGCFHHDGLTDMADAFWGRCPPEERLRIMKDPRVGARGVTAVVLVLLLELSAIYALPMRISGSSGRFRWAALLAFPVAGRWVMSYLCVRFPYARKEGTASVMVKGSKPLHLLVATMIALAGLTVAFSLVVKLPLLIPLLAVVCLTFSELLGGYFHRSVGGVTGDIIGGVGMLAECVILLLMASRVPELLVR